MEHLGNNLYIFYTIPVIRFGSFWQRGCYGFPKRCQKVWNQAANSMMCPQFQRFSLSIWRFLSILLLNLFGYIFWIYFESIWISILSILVLNLFGSLWRNWEILKLYDTPTTNRNLGSTVWMIGMIGITGNGCWDVYTVYVYIHILADHVHAMCLTNGGLLTFGPWI